jgi:hypothetical protein
VHALRNSMTAAGLFLVMQQLKVREDQAPTRWRPLSAGFTMPREELDFTRLFAMKLVALDFETADRSADSACAIGIVSIEKGKITKKGYRLVRRDGISFSPISTVFHGPTWRLSQPSMKFGIISIPLEKCGLFSGAQCSIRSKRPDDLLFGSRS